MSIVIWNARGLGGRRAFLLLQQLVVDLKPLLLFVSEARISTRTACNWLSLLNFNSVFGVDPKGTKGGLLLFWNKEMDVSLRSYSSNHIDVNICWLSIVWRFNGCYAPPVFEDRQAFWELLLKLFKLRNNHSEP